jgi:hypothetical protein
MSAPHVGSAQPSRHGSDHHSAEVSEPHALTRSLKTKHAHLEYLKGKRELEARSAHLNKSTEEVIGDFDLESVTLKMEVGSSIALPRRVTYDVTLTPKVDELARAELYFQSQPERVWYTTSEMEVLPLEFDYLPTEQRLSVLLPSGLRRDAPFTFSMRSGVDYDFEGDPISQSEREDLAHYVGVSLLPLQYDYFTSDLFKVNVEVGVSGRGVFPNASGVLTSRGDPSSGLGLWRFEGERKTFIATFTFTLRPYSQPTALIDATPPELGESTAESEIGSILSDVLSSYASQLFPLGLRRYTASVIPDEAGVAVGPLAMMLLPESLWTAWYYQERSVRLSIDELIAHEVAHQYTPHRLSLAQDAPGWLSEAFAEHLATLYMREQYGSHRLSNNNYWRYMSYQYEGEGEEPSVLSDRIYELPFEAYFIVLYARGVSILHQLSRRLEGFDLLIKRYLEAHDGRVINLEDFLLALEEWGVLSAQRPPSDLNAYLERALFGSARVLATVRASYLNDEESALRVSVASPLEDHLGVRLRSVREGEPLEGERYLLMSAQSELTHSAQALLIDPHQEHFLTLTSARAEDIDLNGVVDGLDVLELLSREGEGVDLPSTANELDDLYHGSSDLTKTS